MRRRKKQDLPVSERDSLKRKVETLEVTLGFHVAVLCGFDPSQGVTGSMGKTCLCVYFVSLKYCPNFLFESLNNFK